MTGKKRSVSVVVATFNAQPTIGECLDSLLAQSYPNDRVEVIVVDNASTDGTCDVLRAYEKRIRVLNEAKRGPAPARNAGIRHAQGELVAFTDANCIADEDWLRNIVEPLDDPSIGIVGGTVRATRPCNRVERYGEAIHDNRQSIDVFRPPHVITGNCCAPLVVLKRLNLFDERFRRSQDVDLSYRAVQAGYRLVFRGDAVVYHRNPRTLPSLFRKGFQHGFHSVHLVKRHRAFLAANGYHGKVNREAYRAIGSRLLDSVRGPDRAASLCDAVFNSGKKLGKACGSLRYRYIEL